MGSNDCRLGKPADAYFHVRCSVRIRVEFISSYPKPLEIRLNTVLRLYVSKSLGYPRTLLNWNERPCVWDARKSIILIHNSGDWNV